MGKNRLLFDENSDLPKVRALLNGAGDEVLEGLRRVIALSARGVDVTDVFSDVLMLISTDDIELKRLIYTILAKHGVEVPDEALMSYNILHKELSNSNPVVRSLALTALVSIRTSEVSDLASEAVRRLLSDPSPIVRMTAVLNSPLLESSDPTNLCTNLSIAARDESPKVRLAAAAVDSGYCSVTNSDALQLGVEWLRPITIHGGHVEDTQVLSAAFSGSPTLACAAATKLCTPFEVVEGEPSQPPKWFHQKIISSALAPNPNSLRASLDTQISALPSYGCRARATLLAPCLRATNTQQRSLKLVHLLPGLVECDDTSLAKLTLLESMLEGASDSETEDVVNRLVTSLFAPQSMKKLGAVVSLLSNIALRDDVCGRKAISALLTPIISDTDICPAWLTGVCVASLTRVLETNPKLSMAPMVGVALIEYATNSNNSEWRDLDIREVGHAAPSFSTSSFPCSIRSLVSSTSSALMATKCNVDNDNDNRAVNEPGDVASAPLTEIGQFTEGVYYQAPGLTLPGIPPYAPPQPMVVPEQKYQPQQAMSQQLPSTKQPMSLDDFFGSPI